MLLVVGELARLNSQTNKKLTPKNLKMFEPSQNITQQYRKPSNTSAIMSWKEEVKSLPVNTESNNICHLANEGAISNQVDYYLRCVNLKVGYYAACLR